MIFGVCMCAPGTVMQENSNTSEIFWDLLRTSQVCFSRDMSWPGYGWSLTRAAALVAWLTLSVNPVVKHGETVASPNLPIRNQNWEKGKEDKERRRRKKTKRRGQKMITFHLKSLAKKCLKFWNDAYAETLIVLHLSFFLHFGLDKLPFQHQSSCVQNFVIMINFWWRRGKLWWTFPFVILCDSLCLFYPFLNFVRNA